MKNTIRISVGIAALISAAALANAQTETPSPQAEANYESRTLGQDRATETQSPQQGAEERGSAAEQQGAATERLAQPPQTEEQKAERTAPVTVPGTKESDAQQGMKQGAEQKRTEGVPRTGALEERGANPQGGAAEQRLQQGRHPLAQQGAPNPGAQQRGTMRQGQATPAQPGGPAARQQWTQGQRTQGSTMMSPDQEARIRDRVRSEHSARAGRADFGLNVGAVVPRSERLAVLPEDVVTIAPRFRGYKFVIVEDEIVIVDPRTYRVAAVIPEAGGPGLERGGPAPLPGGPRVRGCVRC
jgi:Protein of unknown function (DUF1236)